MCLGSDVHLCTGTSETSCDHTTGPGIPVSSPRSPTGRNSATSEGVGLGGILKWFNNSCRGRSSRRWGGGALGSVWALPAWTAREGLARG